MVFHDLANIYHFLKPRAKETATKTAVMDMLEIAIDNINQGLKNESMTSEVL